VAVWRKSKQLISVLAYLVVLLTVSGFVPSVVFSVLVSAWEKETQSAISFPREKLQMDAPRFQNTGLKYSLAEVQTS